MLYKRGSKWWVRFTARGREIRVTSGTDRRELAEEFEQRLREAIWREKALGQEVHTWEEAIERWFREKAHKRSLERDRQAFKAINLSGDIAGDTPDGLSVVGARERAAYKSLVNSAVRWGWLDKAPKVEMPHAQKHEPRWITKEQFERLCQELPAHAEAIARFAVSTGLRSANVRGLRWDNVDMGQKLLRVLAGESKSNRSLGLPISPAAARVLARQAGKHGEYVFTDHKGRAPIRSIKTCWAKAIKRAGLQGLRFHDLRHTWAAWHTLQGTPPIVLKELGGWSSLSMVERYAHLNPGHLSAWANNAVPYKSRHTRTKKRVKSKRKQSRNALRMRRSTN